MTNVDPALLWLLGILVAFIAALVGVIYATVVKNQEKSENLQKEQHKDTEEKQARQYADLWTAINHLRENHHTLDKCQSGWCQKHEDVMADHTKHIASLDGKLGRYCYTVAEHDARIGNMDHKQSSLKKNIL